MFFGLWEEAAEFGENPQIHEENVQTHHITVPVEIQPYKTRMLELVKFS